MLNGGTVNCMQYSGQTFSTIIKKLRPNARTDSGNDSEWEYLLARHKLINSHKNQSLRPMKSLIKLPQSGST